MPETCGCYTIVDYNGQEIVRCNLHARAAEMRELLTILVDDFDNALEQKPLVMQEARALLEATR